eukprot:7161014-Pyramimonas_sp.AAC.1
MVKEHLRAKAPRRSPMNLAPTLAFGMPFASYPLPLGLSWEQLGPYWRLVGGLLGRVGAIVGAPEAANHGAKTKHTNAVNTH